MSFSFTPWMLPYAVGVFASLLILLYAAKIPFKRRYHEIWIILCATAALNLAAFALARMAGDLDTWNPFARIVVFITPASDVLIYHFALDFVSPKLGRMQRYSLFAAYAAVFVFWGTILLSPNLMFTGARRTPLGYFTSTPAPLSLFFFPFLLIMHVLAIVVLFRYYAMQESPVAKAQTRYLLSGFLLSLFSAISSFVATLLGGFPLDFLFPAALVVQFVGMRKHWVGWVTPAAENVSVAPPRFTLSSGASYLALEQEPSHTFEVFSDLIQHGSFGFCVTRSSPDVIRQRYMLEKTPIRWLAAVKRDDAIEPRDLLGLSLIIGQFLQTAPTSVVLLHGIEYLASVNGFKPVLQLVQRLNDLSVEKKSILLLPLVPGSLGEEAQALLVAECIKLPIPSTKT